MIVSNEYVCILSDIQGGLVYYCQAIKHIRSTVYEYIYTRSVITVYTQKTRTGRTFPQAGIASSKGIERKWDSNLTSKAYYYWGRGPLRTFIPRNIQKRNVRNSCFSELKKKKIHVLYIYIFFLNPHFDRLTQIRNIYSI